ncbi:MAG: tetratricopeptide repeat protein, partial [Xanthomonadales bacterium]|nr:tetratricopeptide repeat protein [Xanthomonadales bacterium]
MLLAGLLLGTAALAQSDFRRAQELAFSGEREAARELCYEILSESPGHLDARILLGRTYAWDGRYEEARKELAYALQQRPDYTDARNALVDVEMWDDKYERALMLLDAGLARNPTNADFLYKKARVLRKLE